MSRPAVAVEDLSVRYGDRLAVESVSFDLPEGGALAVVGPNGAGKTTLLRALLGLVRPMRGRIALFGRDPRETPPRSVGYVPQLKTPDPRFPALAIELVLSGIRRRWPGFVRRDERRRAEEALGRVGGAHLAGRPIGTLSGGERQRVYLARCLVSGPRLLLLDEPVTGVDAVGERDFYRHLEAYRAATGATLVIITHDRQVASYHSTHVLLLNRRPFGFGPPAEALAEERVRAAYGHGGHAHEPPAGEGGE